MQVFSINSGTSGGVQFAGLSSGYYIFRIEARDRELVAERLVIRRLLEVVGKFTKGKACTCSCTFDYFTLL